MQQLDERVLAVVSFAFLKLSEDILYSATRLLGHSILICSHSIKSRYRYTGAGPFICLIRTMSINDLVCTQIVTAILLT